MKKLLTAGKCAIVGCLNPGVEGIQRWIIPIFYAMRENLISIYKIMHLLFFQMYHHIKIFFMLILALGSGFASETSEQIQTVPVLDQSLSAFHAERYQEDQLYFTGIAYVPSFHARRNEDKVKIKIVSDYQNFFNDGFKQALYTSLKIPHNFTEIGFTIHSLKIIKILAWCPLARADNPHFSH